MCEVRGLTAGLSALAPSGAVLSNAHTAALQSSLVLLQSANKFASVKLWGKVQGATRDYFIAQGVGDDALGVAKNFYSTDCLSWAMLPEVHPVLAASSLRIKTRFTGTASKEYTVTEPGPLASDPPLDLPADVAAARKTETKDETVTVTTTLTEEKRLAAVVQQIDLECAVVPHGALVKRADGKVEATRNFEGLEMAEAGKLHNYLHLRPPVVKRSPLERAQQDKALDFLDPVSIDVPNGCWALQYERGGSVAVLKSLLWPGFTFYHAPNTSDHGYLYTGIGQRNADLAFMLA